MDMNEFAPRLGGPAAGVVITVGASGLGLAAAHALAAVGRPVVLWDIDADGARAAAQAITAAYSVQSIDLAVDLRDPQAIGPAAQRTRGAIGTVGGIVHCAGTAEST